MFIGMAINIYTPEMMGGSGSGGGGIPSNGIVDRFGIGVVDRFAVQITGR